jgi:hypothetical protein
MDNEEQLVALNQAATDIKKKLGDIVVGGFHISTAKAQSNLTEAVLHTIKIAHFILTDSEEGVINQKVTISLSFERAIDGSFVFACYFWGGFGSINVVRKYAPIDEEPANGANAYEPQGIWYTKEFLIEFSRNPYVIELYEDSAEFSSLSFYGKSNGKCDIKVMVNFIRSVIINLPGSEALLCADETTREQLILARIGQGDYRKSLEIKWDGRCSVSGIDIREILRASHIKPWKLSDNSERRDPENGLLLAAHLDALFDRYLISFTDEGNMMVNEKIKSALSGRHGFEGNIRNDQGQIGAKLKTYLASHRLEFERRVA